MWDFQAATIFQPFHWSKSLKWSGVWVVSSTKYLCGPVQQIFSILFAVFLQGKTLLNYYLPPTVHWHVTWRNYKLIQFSQQENINLSWWAHTENFVCYDPRLFSSHDQLLTILSGESMDIRLLYKYIDILTSKQQVASASVRTPQTRVTCMLASDTFGEDLVNNITQNTSDSSINMYASNVDHYKLSQVIYKC